MIVLRPPTNWPLRDGVLLIAGTRGFIVAPGYEAK